MDIAMVGLGKMGGNMARRLLRAGHRVVVWNRTPDKAEKLAREGAEAASSLKELVRSLPSPRVVWCMLPAGGATEAAMRDIVPHLETGDVLVDGANAHYKYDFARSQELAASGVLYMDAGVSGGVWGLENGYCIMLGGSEEGFELLRPALESLSPVDGYMHCGPAGAGHFVKMIHNGIEYGMMQAYAEGFALLEASPFGGTLEYTALCGLWNQGSVIRSWLLELAQEAFAKSPRLEEIAPHVQDSGEGRWSVETAVNLGVSAPVMSAALFERFRSREDNSFADRLLAALRNEFGGHGYKKI